MNNLSCSSISFSKHDLETDSNTLSLVMNVMKIARDKNKDIILKKILCPNSENLENYRNRGFKKALLEKKLLAQQG